MKLYIYILHNYISIYNKSYKLSYDYTLPLNDTDLFTKNQHKRSKL